MALTTTQALVGLLVLSLLVNIMQFASDTHCVCPHCPRQQQEVVRQQARCDCSGKRSSPSSFSNSHKHDDENSNNNNNNNNDNNDNNDHHEHKDNNNHDADQGEKHEQHNNGGDGDGEYKGEIGWRLGTERVSVRTDNTKYDPREDDDLEKKTLTAGGKGANKYSRSPVPRGSWKIRVARQPERWVLLDDAVFAYDIWFEENKVFQYMHWLGAGPIQQDPSDAFAIQMMLWELKPDLIVEVGANNGAGAIFYYSIMKYYNANAKVVTLDVKPCCSNWNSRNDHRCRAGPDGTKCITGDKHPLWKEGNIHYIQGRVTEQKTQSQVQEYVDRAKTVLVVEDASHRSPDTLHNLEAIYKWVTVGSMLLCQDTKMDRFVASLRKKHARLKFGPMADVMAFMKNREPGTWKIDRSYEFLAYSQHHRGWLRRMK